MSTQREDDAATPKRPISAGEDVPLPMAKRPMFKKPGLDDTSAENEIERLKVEDKDIVSDAALWDLYRRWMVFYKIDRNKNEQEERFPIFKERATSIHQFNHEKHTWTKALSDWSDSHRHEVERFFCKIESSSSSDGE